ncbi:hypothetical protein GCM10009838_18170 [Catenulispora subtropica]|uniref:Uncharacterized protein n=1 Tax=Catenulispora subtropica TaxID=450798 RepID=A0ABN2R1I0_9ACTN
MARGPARNGRGSLARHEYGTIAAGRLSMHLAEIALTPAVTERPLKRIAD